LTLLMSTKSLYGKVAQQNKRRGFNKRIVRYLKVKKRGKSKMKSIRKSQEINLRKETNSGGLGGAGWL